MDDRQKRIMKNSSLERSIDEQNPNIHSHCQRLIPISMDHLPSSTIISHKRRRSSTINEQSELFFNNQHFIYNQNILPITTTTRKRPIQDEYFSQEYDQQVNKA
jgi:hypothetical protein